jgi:hypothetical protein
VPAERDPVVLMGLRSDHYIKGYRSNFRFTLPPDNVIARLDRAIQ